MAQPYERIHIPEPPLPWPDLRQPGVYQDFIDQGRVPFLYQSPSIPVENQREEGDDDGLTSSGIDNSGAVISEIALLLIPTADGSPVKPYRIPFAEAAEIAEIRAKLSTLR